MSRHVNTNCPPSHRQPALINPPPPQRLISAVRQDGEPTREISLSPGYRKRRLIRPTCRSEPPRIEAAFDSAADWASDRLEETWTTRSVRDVGFDRWGWFILKVMHRKLFFTSCLACCCCWWSKLISSLAVSSVCQREEKTGRTDSSSSTSSSASFF